MDTVLTIINAVATIIAVISAVQSIKFYKKSKALVDHTNMSKALVEIENMLNKLPEALLVTNKSRQNNHKGINLNKVIGDIGKDLNTSYLAVHSSVPPAYTNELFNLENTMRFNLQKYINTYIDGTAIDKGELDPIKYADCQTQLMKMQNCLKVHIEEMPKRI